MKVVTFSIHSCMMIVNRVVQPQKLTKQMKWLRENTSKYTTESTIWEDIDVCTEQYRCTVALYLLSLLAHEYQIFIYQ